MTREIHFVTGKGGVGKSTCALGLAAAASRAGRKTLLVELGDRSYFRDFLRLPAVGYAPTASGHGFDLAKWSGPECLREYAGHLIRVDTLAELFFSNNVSRSLIEIAPAVKELAVLGKATSGPRGHGPASPHEVLVIDAPSTGHFLALMRAPGGMAEAVRFGPMGEQSRSILASLRDPALCRYHLVTLAEEMPLKETEELAAELRPLVGGNIDVILNKVQKIPGDLPPAEAHPFFGFLRSQDLRQKQALERMRELSREPRQVPRIMAFEPDAFVPEVARAFA
jgi:anion-transporting  ArsA/GET3 family ATPase